MTTLVIVGIVLVVVALWSIHKYLADKALAKLQAEHERKEF